MPIPVADGPQGAAFDVRVVPRAGRTGVAGLRGSALLVRIAAAPVDGAANDALIACLAALLDRPRRDVAILSGAASRDKRVAVRGIAAAELRDRLEALAGGGTRP